jgi:hypothetical protein
MRGFTCAIIEITFANLVPAKAVRQDKATAAKQHFARYFAYKAAKTNNANIPCINIEWLTTKHKKYTHALFSNGGVLICLFYNLSTGTGNHRHLSCCV